MGTFSKDSLVQRLSSKNWKIVTTEGDNYLWLQQDKRFVIAYFLTQTARDGKYNASDAFPTGWRFSPAGPDYKPIKLPGE